MALSHKSWRLWRNPLNVTGAISIQINDTKILIDNKLFAYLVFEKKHRAWCIEYCNSRGKRTRKKSYSTSRDDLINDILEKVYEGL